MSKFIASKVDSWIDNMSIPTVYVRCVTKYLKNQVSYKNPKINNDQLVAKKLISYARLILSRGLEPALHLRFIIRVGVMPISNYVFSR